MAIHRLLKDSQFGPDDIALMTVAFNAALKRMSVTDSMSPVAILIAKNIVDAAKRGDRDPARLYEKGLGLCKPSDQSRPVVPNRLASPMIPLEQTTTSEPAKASEPAKTARRAKRASQSKDMGRTKASSRTKSSDRRKTSARGKSSASVNGLSPTKA
jgi:hypothetical protein